MQITINSKSIDVDNNISVDKLLLLQNISKETSVLTINDNFVDKETYISTIIKENDNIEIMSFVGGG